MQTITKHRIAAVSAAVLIVGYAILSIRFHIGIPCIFHVLTGLYCPGCGLGRSVLSLLSGDWYQAFRYNVLLMPCILPGTILLIYTFFQVMCGTPIHRTFLAHAAERFGLLIACVLILFSILRNIFDILAPTSVL